MAKQTRTPDNQIRDPNITWRDTFSLGQREAMIREVAYSYYAKRGYIHGHDLDDWLAAETELDLKTPEPQESPSDMEPQLSSVHGPAMDEKLDQVITQHPLKLYHKSRVWSRKMHR
ncbi:Protein of unknown function (DUF2934) [Nitrosomonas sp. Nm84]|uniref:DUF2934 domain-containing protein n=1 Tax=Nitrosomonas sp. Nm84 TaxID=200124 RepID=UPI000D76F5B5|nr:DUF2934 domain-containing protein [Nitrosomonas sp. Nm84]PXW88385.1 Protein of unknown function (DUF2934) [Nitrosomonas sp. Nm84]